MEMPEPQRKVEVLVLPDNGNTPAATIEMIGRLIPVAEQINFAQELNRQNPKAKNRVVVHVDKGLIWIEDLNAEASMETSRRLASHD